ncbi:MAG: TonB-dependent receptor [Thiohalophilus sp.]|jgi:vitamin B12 transporter
MSSDLLRRGVITTLASLALAHTAAAQEEPIIVTATRTAQLADETLSPVIVIDRETLESQPGAEITDLLHRYPGIDISRNGGPGQTPSIFIRGAESDHTLVMVNGIKINPGTIGISSVQHIPLEMIERIEIVKGPRSTLYGSDAIGGVINIITRKQQQQGSHYEARVGGGSFDTRSAGFSAHNRADDRAAGIDVNYRESKGFPTLKSENIDRGYDNLSVNVYGQKQLGDVEATIEHWQSSGTTEYMDYDALYNLVPVDQDFDSSTTSLSLDYNPTADWVSKLKLSYFKDDIQQNQNNDFARTHRRVADWQNDIQVGESQLFTAGLYVSDESADSLSYGSRFDSDTQVNALFIQDNVSIGNHQLVAGARYTDHETFGNKTTWNLEYGYQLTKQLKMIAAANTGFRAPSSADRFGYGGNPDLKPEESSNQELGLRYQRKRHRFTLNAFDNRIDNLIMYYDPDGWLGPLPGVNENIARTRIKGVEAGYEYTYDNWLLAIDAIDQDPRDESDDSLLLRRPEQKYSLSVSHLGDRHRVQLDVTHVSERQDIDSITFGKITLDAYTLVGLSGDYRFTDAFSVSARIDNLTDEDYQLADGYNTPERSYYMNLRYIF